MLFKINITKSDGELLNIIEINTNEMNWDSCNSKHDTTLEIYDEIYRAVKREHGIEPELIESELRVS